MAQHLKLGLVGGSFVAAQALGQVHHHHFHAVVALLYFDVRLNQVVVVVEGVFDVKYPAVLGKARQQVLGPLPHKIPVQVREAHQVGQAYTAADFRQLIRWAGQRWQEARRGASTVEEGGMKNSRKMGFRAAPA